ncbi:sporulation-induced protein [Spiromyces aspiralis]|uniref:Sporulation-induced protein n=1 Tax=Spiromyces aspiralis TaxID=68401 RepID=A0ACC1HIJ0_9FUNG|nr:sporulation-induced protein [Spiromyces aspiralis]
MFWRFGIQQYLNLDRILDKDNVTLEEVLDDNNVFQQMKTKNQKLVDFLTRPHILSRLVDYVSGSLFFESPRYGQIACELMAMDSPAVLDALMSPYQYSDLIDPDKRHAPEHTKGDSADQHFASPSPSPAHLPSNNNNNNSSSSSTPAATEDTPAVAAVDLDKMTMSPSAENPPSPSLVGSPTASSPGKSHAGRTEDIVAASEGQGPDRWWSEDVPLFARIWRLVSTDPSKVNPIQAACFARLMCVILQYKYNQAIPYIKSHPELISMLLSHVSTSAMMDVLLKLVSMEEIEECRGIVDWLNESGVIQTLVSQLDPHLDPDTHMAAGQVLLDIISISQCSNPEQPTIGTNVLIEELKGKNTVQQLVGYMLHPTAKHSVSSLINGTYIFIELIRRNYNSEWDGDPLASIDQPEQEAQHGFTIGNVPHNQQNLAPLVTVDLSDMMRVLADSVEAFVALLVKPRTDISPHKTPTGPQVPVGFERLRICELLAEILHCSNMRRLNLTREEIEEEEAKLEALCEREHWQQQQVFGGQGLQRRQRRSFSGSFDQQGICDSGSTVPLQGKVDDAGYKNQPPKSDHHNNQEGTAHHNIGGDGGSNSSSNNNSVGGTQPSQLPVGQYLKYKFVEHKALLRCLSLFFEHPWNNFIHSVVYDMMHQTLNLPLVMDANLALIHSVLVDGQLTKRIMQASTLNDEESRKPKGTQLGYMGHLNGITDEVVRLFELVGPELGEPIKQCFEDPDWIEYIENNVKRAQEDVQGPLDSNGTNTSTSNELSDLGSSGGSARNAILSYGEDGEDEDVEGMPHGIQQQGMMFLRDEDEGPSRGFVSRGHSFNEGEYLGDRSRNLDYMVSDEDIDSDDDEEEDEDIRGAPLHRHNSIVESLSDDSDFDDEDEHMFNVTLGVRDDDIYRKHETPGPQMLRFASHQNEEIMPEADDSRWRDDGAPRPGPSEGDTAAHGKGNDESKGRQSWGQVNGTKDDEYHHDGHLQPVLYDDIDVDEADATELGWMK